MEVHKPDRAQGQPAAAPTCSQPYHRVRSADAVSLEDLEELCYHYAHERRGYDLLRNNCQHFAAAMFGACTHGGLAALLAAAREYPS